MLRILSSCLALTAGLAFAACAELDEPLAGRDLAAGSAGTPVEIAQDVFVDLGQSAIVLDPRHPEFRPGTCVDKDWLNGKDWQGNPVIKTELSNAKLQFTRHLIETQSDYQTATSGGFGAALEYSGSGASIVDRARNGRRVNDFRVFFVVKIDVPMEVTRVDYESFLLDAEARKLIAADRYGDFFQRCGNKIVRQITRGGQLMAVFEINNSSYDEYLATSNALKAEISVGGVDLDIGKEAASDTQLRKKLHDARAEIVVAPPDLTNLKLATIEELEGIIKNFGVAMGDKKNWRQLRATVDDYYNDQVRVVLEQGDFGADFVKTKERAERFADGLEACQQAVAAADFIKADLDANGKREVLYDAGSLTVQAAIKKIQAEGAKCIAKNQALLDDCEAGISLGDGKIAVCADKPAATISVPVPRLRAMAEVAAGLHFDGWVMSKDTSRASMVTCPEGSFVSGYWDNEWDAKLYCVKPRLVAGWKFGQQKVSMNTGNCPDKWAMTGHHVTGNYVECAPLEGYDDEKYLQAKQDLNTLGVFCPEGTVLRKHKARQAVYPGHNYSEELWCAAPSP